jgi:WD40 repeat protein
MDDKDLSGQSIKGYELQERIGAGGFGVVYRAHQPLIKREIAIKVVMPEYVNDPNFVRRFEAEAQLVAHVEHIHIVPLYDYWRDQTGAYLVMRWMRGGSLHAELQKDLWPLDRIALLVDQIAGALASAHRKNVIHRDLKPANILLDEDQNAYLADFGIAKDIGHFSDYATVIETEESGAFMGSPAYQSPEQIKSEQVGPQSDIYSFGIMLYEILTGLPPFHGEPISTLIFKHLQDTLPPIHNARPDLPEGVDRVITKATEKDPNARYKTALELAADFRRVAVGSAPVEVTADYAGYDEDAFSDLDDLDVINPFKGLRAFQEADADDFHGRELLVDGMLERLHAEGHAGRFLAVIGPSGSGKSSVVKAGMIPRLRRNALPGSADWFVVEMTPGAHPLEELEAALLRVAINPPASLLEQLREDERGLVRAVKRVLPGGTLIGGELVLLIDQFEETFTRVEDEAERAHFLKSLQTAAQEADSRLRIIVTLRADFYDRPLIYPEFGQLMRECTEVILPLSRAELERAIAGPAERGGLILESGLIESIVADVGEQPGALPLMQYALTELFERREGRQLTVSAYREIGGVSGALAGRATELYHELSEDAQQVARQLFLRLVTLGEGSEDTRRRVLLSELLSLQFDEQAIRDVIDLFGKYRLLTFDHDPATRSPTVEVAHEALIRQWYLLREWIEDSREDLRLQRRLAAATGEWLNAGKDNSYLATGTRLEQFEAWMGETEISLAGDEREYLDASLNQREQQRAEEAARQAREAALERRSRNFLRALAGVLSVATVIALVLTVFAFQQQAAAQQNAEIAEINALEARGLAFVSGSQLALSNNDTDLAILLALEANRIGAPTVQTRRILAEAAYAPGTRRVFQAHTDRVEAGTFSPDGQLAASGARDGRVILWDVNTGEVVHNMQGHNDWVMDVAFSPDGTRVLSSSSDHTLILWDVATGEQIRRFEGHTARVNAVDFGADGGQALSGSEDRTLILWDVESGEIIQQFEGSPNEVTDVALSDSGFTALSSSLDGVIILWNAQSGQPLFIYGPEEGGHSLSAWNVTYTPDELGFISTSEDGTLLLWRFETGAPVLRFEGHTSRVTSAAFSPDGSRLVSGSEDNSVILWDTATGAVLRRFIGHTFLVYDVDFSPTGRQILSASWDGTLRLWDIENGAQLHRLGGHGGDVLGVAFSPDGETAVSASADSNLVLWDVASGEEIRRFEGHQGAVWAAAFSPDGARLISGGEDWDVFVWDVSTGEIIRRMEGHSDTVWAVDFSPDGQTIASGGRDSTLILWDAESGEQLNRLFGHTFRVTGAAFSPDGAMLVSSSFDNTLILWDVATGEIIRRFEGHADWVRSAAFSPDGQLIVSSSADNNLILWNATNGQRLRTFEGHSAQVYSVVFSPDGRYVLSGADDRSVILWEIDTGLEIQRFAGHGGAVRSVAFGPDGRTVLSGSEDNSARMWQIQHTMDEIMAWIRENRHIRELTCVERERYDAPPLCPRPTPIPLPGQSV